MAEEMGLIGADWYTRNPTVPAVPGLELAVRYVAATDGASVGGDWYDVLDLGAGDDRVYAGIGSDTLTGGIGNDLVNGEAGADTVNGGGGSDRLYGKGGKDKLKGGKGFDKLDGGGGVDVCIVDSRKEKRAAKRAKTDPATPLKLDGKT